MALKTFKEFRAEIGINELAAAHGYVPTTGPNEKWQVMKNEAFDDRIMIKNARTPSEQVYMALGGYDTDKGTLVNFVQNRLTSVFSAYNRADKSDMANVNAVLYHHLGMEPIERSRLQQRVRDFSPTKEASEREFQANRFKLEPLDRDNYLTRSRAIFPETLERPEFKDMTKIQVSYMKDGKRLEADSPEASQPGVRLIRNIAFEARTRPDGPVVGLELRNHDFKAHAPGSNRSEGVVMSNQPPQLKKLVISESFIDLMSYHQLEMMKDRQKPFDTVYMSPGGNLGQGQMATMLSTLEKLPRDPGYRVVLGFDNDKKGVDYDFTFIQHYAGQKGMPIAQGERSEQRNRLLLASTPANEAIFEKIVSGINKINTSLNESLRSETSPAIRDEVSRNHFKASTTPNGSLLVEFPNQVSGLAAFNKLYLEASGLSQRIEIQKSLNKDFNDDVKQIENLNQKRPYQLLIDGKTVETYSTALKAVRGLGRVGQETPNARAAIGERIGLDMKIHAKLTNGSVQSSTPFSQKVEEGREAERYSKKRSLFQQNRPKL